MENKRLGLVIVDGVGFRNFILSDFLIEAKSKYANVIIFSGLPQHVYNNTPAADCTIVLLDDFREPSKTWFFRKLKENAHLQQHKKGNFGIQDNLNVTYPKGKSKRARITRAIFKWCSIFNSETWVARYYNWQERSFVKHPSTTKYIEFLKEHQPDVLYFTHQRPPYIAPLIYAARKQQIPTGTFIFSWDNLASKGRMAGVFDFYHVWSDLMKSELLEFYKLVSDTQIAVVGTPQFEPYTLERYKSTKEDYHRKFQLDAAKPTICFSCGDVSTSRNDDIYISTIAEAIQNKALIKEVNFLVRTSPAENDSRFAAVRDRFPFIRWNVPKWELSREDHSEIWSQRVPTVEDMTDLRMILEYSDLGINMCSTMSLDMMMFDKPVINPVFGNQENGLYDDQRFLNYAHYKKVVESGAVEITKNAEELINGINKVLETPTLRVDEQKALIQLQVGQALAATGKRISDQILEQV